MQRSLSGRERLPQRGFVVKRLRHSASVSFYKQGSSHGTGPCPTRLVLAKQCLW